MLCKSDKPSIIIIIIIIMREVKDMGQHMGYRRLQWNWLKEAMNIPNWAGIVAGAKLFNFLFNSSYKLRVNSSS